MKCPRCDAETNPTLLYCTACGGPVEADVDDVFADEAKKVAERRLIEAVQKAKEVLVLTLFALACVIGLRVVLLKKPSADRTTTFMVPYTVIEEANADPTAALPVEELIVPIPDPDAAKPPATPDKPDKQE